MFNISLAKHISWQYLEVEEFAFVYNIKTKKYYIFRDSELIIWLYLSKKEKNSILEIVEYISNYYDINNKEEIFEDISKFITSLIEIGVVDDVR